MAKLGIFTGTSPNDSSGDTLSQGAVKINSNFSEIYNAIGDGTNITNSIGYANTAGIATNVIGGIASVTNFSASGIATVSSSNLKVRNPANTFQYSIAASAITADRTITLPLITGSDTFATLGLGQSFSGISTFTNTFVLSQTTQNIDLGSTQTTGTWTAGGTNQTGSVTLGISTNSQTVNIATGIGSTGTTKNINIGTGSSGITRITVGSASTFGIGTFAINPGMNVGIGSTIPQYTLDVSGDIRTTGTIYGNVSGSISVATTATNVINGIASVATLNVSGITTLGVTTISQLQVTGISTFTNGPVLVGRATTTGTANQALQVESGAYFNSSVGIGTTNPSVKLDVIGNTKVKGDLTVSNGDLYITRTDDVGGDIFANGGTDGKFGIYNTTNSGSIELITKNSLGINNNILKVTSEIATVNGNLGIGTTNPTSSLSVNGSTVIGTEILNMTGLSSTFTTVGSNTFTVPAGVTKISAVLIGGGGAGGGGSPGTPSGTGNGAGGQGGGGGGLRYVNDFAVTPGQTLTVVVGAGGVGGTGNGGNGEDSSITGIATAFGGTGGLESNTGIPVGAGGSGSGGQGGATGGSGGTATLTTGAGGGGAAGYSGNGGTGGNGSVSNGGVAGSGGGAGGGAAPTASGSGGGGIGVLGQGTSGLLSNGAGNAGSGGSNGSTGNTTNGAAGGLYGGGGGGADGATTSGPHNGGNGGQGIVRIIWSPSSKFSRLFPTNQVGNNINQ